MSDQPVDIQSVMDAAAKMRETQARLKALRAEMKALQAKITELRMQYDKLLSDEEEYGVAFFKAAGIEVQPPR